MLILPKIYHPTPSSFAKSHLNWSEKSRLFQQSTMGFLGRLKFFAKSVVFGSLIAACALYGVFASIVLRIIGKGEYAQYTVARAFYYSMRALLGIKITIKNEHYLKEMPSVVVANHQSALDIFILGRVFLPGYTVTAKKALKYVPFLGWFMMASGTFFLDRAKGDKARKVLEAALVSLKKEKRLIFMFPEGTRSATKKLEMGPFKKGAFHLAKQADIPVVPVAVSNYSHIFQSQDKVFNRGEIIIEVLKPMPTSLLATNEDVTKFAYNVSEKMLQSIETMGYAPAYGDTRVETSPTQSDVSDVSVEIVD